MIYAKELKDEDVIMQDATNILILIGIENGSPWPWPLVVAGYRLGSYESVHVSNEQGHKSHVV